MDDQLTQNYTRLKQISDELNLSFETQDWGIINSDENRVSEFISFFNENSDLENSLKYEVYELIIASFNDLLLIGPPPQSKESEFLDFVQGVKFEELFKPINRYWKSIKSSQYPVGNYL